MVFRPVLNELPVEMATWPLVMVSRGPGEQQLVRYFLEHHLELERYWRQIEELHAKTLLKEISMQEVDYRLRQAGFKDEKEYFDLLVKAVGSEEKLASLLDERDLMRSLIERLGLEEVQRLIQQIADENPSTAG
jgi:hypothetical protein